MSRGGLQLQASGLAAQLAADLGEAKTAADRDPLTGLELLAQVVLASAEACLMGDEDCTPPLRASVAALLGVLLNLLQHPQSRSPQQVAMLARDAAVWEAVRSSMAAVYGVDDPKLATAVLRGWRSCAAALLHPRQLSHEAGDRNEAVGAADMPAVVDTDDGFGYGGALEGYSPEGASAGLLHEDIADADIRRDDAASAVNLPRPPGAIIADPRFMDPFLRRCVAHARALAPLDGLAARVVSLLRAFQTCCGVNPCHDGDPLQLLMLWLQVLLHPSLPPPPSLEPQQVPRGGAQCSNGGCGGGGGGGSGAGGGGGAAAGAAMAAAGQAPTSAPAPAEPGGGNGAWEKTVLAAACGDLYPLAAPAMERWVASFEQLLHQHMQQQQQQQQQSMGQWEGVQSSSSVKGKTAAAVVPDGAVQGREGPLLDDQRRQRQQAEQPQAQEPGDGAVSEPLAPPILFFEVLMAVVQDGAADSAAWSPYIAAALEQTAQQLFALLRGSPDTYSACWAVQLAAAEESLAAAGAGTAADDWSADPGVSRALDLLRSYSGLPLVVRAALARAGDSRKKVAAILSVLKAMCRPSGDAAPALSSGGGDGDGGGANSGGGDERCSYSGPHPMARLVDLCCELLLPESNCPVDVRVAALQALCSALDEHLAFLDEHKTRLQRQQQQQQQQQQQPQLQRRGRRGRAEKRGRRKHGGAVGAAGSADSSGDDSGGNGGCADGGAVGSRDGGQPGGSGGSGGSGHLAALLWSPSSVDALFFSLLHDPSIKVRRSAMRLMSLVVLPAGSDGAIRLTRTLLTKLRDKDALVSDRALELLVQLPPPLLARAIAAPEPGEGGPADHDGAAGSSARACSWQEEVWRESWASLVQHCISGQAAAAPTAAAAPSEVTDDGGGTGDGGSAVVLGGRAENCIKLLKAILKAAAADGALLAAPLGSVAAPALHPMELLLLPALAAGDASEIDAAIVTMRRAEAVASSAPCDQL